MPRLLLIEDDIHFSGVLAAALTQRGHHLTAVPTAADGLREAGEGFDAVLADLGLPDLGGIELIRRLRSTSQVPIIVLSGHRETEIVVRALDAGADDFVAKPFKLVDLEARLRAALRRPGLARLPHVLDIGGLHIDIEQRAVTREGRPVRLTPTEWRVLVAILTGRGRVVGYDTLARAVWERADHILARESLRVHVAALRTKLGEARIVTESGVGYRWTVDSERDDDIEQLPEPQRPVDDDAPDARDAPAPQPGPSDETRVVELRRLRHDLNNAAATLTVIAGMLDPGADLEEDARAEAGARLARCVARMNTVVAEVSERLV